MIKRLLTHIDQMDPDYALLWLSGSVLIIGLISLPVAVAYSYYCILKALSHVAKR